MGIFLFLGGYGIYKSYTGNDNKFVFNKLFRLYKSFWKVFIVVVPISVILHVPNIIGNFSDFIWNITGINTSYNGEWWFFTTYAILVILSPLLIKIINKRNNGIIFDFIFIFLFNIFVMYIFPQIMNFSIFDNYRNTIVYIQINNSIMWASCFICGLLFAKYNILDLVKKKMTGKYLYDVLAILLLFSIFVLRRKTGTTYDFINSALFSICIIILFSHPILKMVKKILLYIGKQSTNIWLVHSFYCYLWFQNIIFLPKYTFFIFLFLLIISYVTGLMIDYIYKKLVKVLKKIENNDRLRHKVID